MNTVETEVGKLMRVLEAVKRFEASVIKCECNSVEFDDELLQDLFRICDQIRGDL